MYYAVNKKKEDTERFWTDYSNWKFYGYKYKREDISISLLFLLNLSDVVYFYMGEGGLNIQSQDTLYFIYR